MTVETITLNDLNADEVVEETPTRKRGTKKKDAVVEVSTDAKSDPKFIELRKKLNDKEHPLDSAQIVDLLEDVINEKNYNKLLSSVNCSRFVTVKDGANNTKLKYMTWAAVEGIMSQLDLDFDYTFDTYQDPLDGITKEYLPDFRLNQANIKCNMTFLGITKSETLPIQSGFKNNAVPLNSLTVNDVNKAKKRCMVKTAAKFGLGRYLYEGDDLPSDVDDTPVTFVPHAPVEPLKVDEITGEVETVTVAHEAPKSNGSVTQAPVGTTPMGTMSVQNMVRERSKDVNSKRIESTMSLEEAMAHQTDGNSLYENLMSARTKGELEQVKGVMKSFYHGTDGDASDQQCAIALYNAIRDGKITLPKFD